MGNDYAGLSTQVGRLILLVLLGMLAACASKPQYFRDGIAEVGKDASIAILPPVNLSQYDKASDIVMNALVVEVLQSGVFEVVDPGVVEGVILERRIRLTDRIPLDVIHEISKELAVQYLLVGTVNDFQVNQSQGGSVPTVSIALRVIRASDGRIVWAATHTRRGDDAETVFGLGKIATPERLAEVMVHDMVKTITR